MAKKRTAAPIPYSRKELRAPGPQRSFTGPALKEITFPLGGIGTGCITLGGWGQLRDWQIRNRPAVGYAPGDCFFTLKARAVGAGGARGGGGREVIKVLQGPPGRDYGAGGHSADRIRGEGLPCFREARFTGEFPVATVELTDKKMPLDVTLEAYNPYIPLNAADSSIPCAILTYHLKNRGRKSVRATVYGNLTNIIGEEKGRKNSQRKARGLTALELTNPTTKTSAPGHGSMALATTSPRASVWKNWPRGGWNTKQLKLWEALQQKSFPPKIKPTGAVLDTGTLATELTVGAGKTKSVTFIIAWHFPNCPNWRDTGPGRCKPSERSWKNWYATEWPGAWAVARYVAKDLKRLEAETKRFRDALFSSTLPAHVLDAVSSQISILKTPTVLRLSGGEFYGFEGCSNASGCCEGSCTHVWNYAQALPYLFPDLQRSQREAQYEYDQTPDGAETFRLPLPLGTGASPACCGVHPYHPAADGQMGGVMQVYREWLICGDDGWLRRMWPKAKAALEFAWKYWDADRDGVMEGMQHNTYDIEFYGPNTLMGSLYLGALRAAEEMARHLGDDESADEYRRIFESGSKKTDRTLFNGEYYEQKVLPGAHRKAPKRLAEMSQRIGRDDRYPWPKWQYGTGCLADQLLGQWYGEMLGLGKLYRHRNVKKALGAIFRHNWRSELFDHPCLFRIYAMNDEAGLLVCTWPRGGRPGYAFSYGDEVWCGIEYQVASHMIYEGLVDEGLSIVKGVRDRHDGARRSPWDEFECGHYYARSMASYAVMLALEGFSYSAPGKRMGFAPRLGAKDFRGFWCVGSGYGVYSQKLLGGKRRMTVSVASGALELRELTFEGKGGKVSAKLGGRPLKAELALDASVGPAGRAREGREGRVRFGRAVTVRPGRELVVTVS